MSSLSILSLFDSLKIFPTEMFAFLIVSLLVLNEVSIPIVAEPCYCPDSPQDVTKWGYIYIQNAVDDYGNACKQNCTIKAYSGDNGKGLTFFNIQVFEPEEKNLAIIEVIDSNKQTIISVNGESNQSSSNYGIISETANVTIKLTLLTDEAVTIFGTMQQAGVLGTPSPPTTTPVASTTRKYTGGLLHDPWLVSHDLMFMIDSTRGQGREAFETMQNLTVSIVNQLSITDLANSTADTRLALRKLDNNSGVVYGNDWKMTAEDFKDNVSSIDWKDVGANATFVSAIINAITTAFNVGSIDGTRKNAQRTIVILTSSSPSDLDDFVFVEELFEANDVKLLIIGYNNITGTAYKNYPWITFYQAKNSNDVTVQEILGKYFVTANSLCKTTSDPQIIELTSDYPSRNISMPENYQGPNDEETSPTWPPGMSYQTGRYCNFQDNTYVFKYEGYVCFITYYDLEVEKDYVRIYEGEGKTKSELVSLTGYDITGTALKLNGPATVRFLSDSRQVFGGFYIKAFVC